MTPPTIYLTDEYFSTGGIGTGVDPASLGPLFHGGVPGLTAGDIIAPGHQRRPHDNCPWCEARARGAAHYGTDGPSQHQDRVYATENRLYARFHASLWGRGDLYRVTPVGGDVQRSDEDTIPSIHAPALRIIQVADVAVLLTDTERRRLNREWERADMAALGPARFAQSALAERNHR